MFQEQPGDLWLEQTEGGESSEGGGPRPSGVGGTLQGPGCPGAGFTFHSEPSSCVPSPSHVTCCWLGSSQRTRWGWGMSNHHRALSRGGCDPIRPLWCCSVCSLYNSLSPPYPSNSNVSPGWEVMELVRPIRGYPPNPLCVCVCVCVCLSSFILRERESAQGREQNERETENPKQAPHCQHRARCGARTHEP